MKTIFSSFHCELLQKLKQLNIIFLNISIVKREALPVFLLLWANKNTKLNKSQIYINGQNKLDIYFAISHNKINSYHFFKEKLKKCVSAYCAKHFFSYLTCFFLKSLPFHSSQSAIL